MSHSLRSFTIHGIFLWWRLRERPPAALRLQAASLSPFSVDCGPCPVRSFTEPSHHGHALRVRLSPPDFTGAIKKWVLLDPFFYCYGGDGESRTRVRKHFHRNFSERSSCFSVSPFPAPINRLWNQLSRCSSVIPGTLTEFSCMVDARFRAYR